MHHPTMLYTCTYRTIYLCIYIYIYYTTTTTTTIILLRLYYYTYQYIPLYQYTTITTSITATTTTSVVVALFKAAQGGKMDRCWMDRCLNRGLMVFFHSLNTPNPITKLVI